MANIKFKRGNVVITIKETRAGWGGMTRLMSMVLEYEGTKREITLVLGKFITNDAEMIAIMNPILVRELGVTETEATKLSLYATNAWMAEHHKLRAIEMAEEIGVEIL